MPRIKIIEITPGECYSEDYWDGGVTTAAFKSVDEWKEVSDEDCKILREWARWRNRNADCGRADGYSITHIFVLEELTAEQVKKSVEDYLVQAKAQEAANKKLAAKYEAGMKKRAAALAAKKAEREKKLLKQLLEKHGTTGMSVDTGDLM